MIVSGTQWSLPRRLLVTIGAFIGVRSQNAAYRGFQRGLTVEVLAGLVMVIALALLLDALAVGVGALAPWRRVMDLLFEALSMAGGWTQLARANGILEQWVSTSSSLQLLFLFRHSSRANRTVSGTPARKNLVNGTGAARVTLLLASSHPGWLVAWNELASPLVALVALAIRRLSQVHIPV